MEKTAIQIQALYLSQQLKKQQEPEGGMLYFDQLMKCRLDFTPPSIRRLEKLFSLLRNKGVTLEKILSHPKHKNFLLTIAVYLGEYVGRRLGEVPIWFDHQGFSELTNNDEIPEQFAFSLIAQFQFGICLPFGPIQESFTNPFLLSDYVEETCNNMLSKAVFNAHAPASDICNFNLQKIRTGRLVDNTMAYADLLKKIHFDYSMHSLEHIDRVLSVIKQREALGKKRLFKKSPYEAFMQDPDRLLFIYFVGCYIAMTSAQLAKTSAKWFNHEEMQSMLNDPDFVFCLEHNQVIMCNGGYLRLPLMAVTNYFFELNPQSSMGAVDFARNMLRDNKENLNSYPIAKVKSLENQASIPEDWKTAMSLAGQLAAWNMVHISDGGMVSPKSLDYHGKDKQILLIDHVDGDIENLLEQLEFPPVEGKAPFGFLSYDMYANLPTGRTDGISMRIKVYSEPSLTLDIVIPYRHADHHMGFAIFPVVHYQAENAPDDKFLPALVRAFYKGAKGFTDPMLGVDYWTSYYIGKQDIFAPSAWTRKPIETFDPKKSKITILPL